MDIDSRVGALRDLMNKHEMDAYIVTSYDPHLSEYVPERWKTREWISGFTGSAGTFITTKEKAGLWVDSRYFVQAEQELVGSNIQLFKMGLPDTPSAFKWLAKELFPEAVVGVDGSCISVNQTRNLRNQLGDFGIHIEWELDLINQLWEDRPATPNSPLLNYPVAYSGESRTSKLERIREVMRKNDCNYHFVGSLDDIAWIFNIRGNDIAYNPLLLAYAIITQENATIYLCDETDYLEVIKEFETENIIINSYDRIFSDLEEIPGSANVLLDADRTNLRAFNSITANIVEKENPSQLLKSLKNEVEIKGMKNALIRDGVALEKFFFWLEKNVGKIKLTESAVMDKLLEFRAAQKDFKGASFNTICGYKEHAALPHYSTTPQSDCEIFPEGLLLIDSGGQYLDGTTDITRTIPMGELSDAEKTDFTLVLKGMIQLAMAVFPVGTRGCNIDMLARYDLWKNLRNFGHGTGHGVGAFMNVHEGPQSIRQELKDQPILCNMITSDEPGLYRIGKYGIRHENLILCKEFGSSEFGDFLTFETITLCHFETKGIKTELLTEEERSWLNTYHEKVYQTLSPYLEKDEKEWLKQKTQRI